jgi:aspartyl-tRNA(Asn)/glutamyl-tRNA(Gln) amidotransferase subunit C
MQIDYFSCYSMLNEDEIKKIARLSRLALSPEELQKYQKELSEILSFFEKLQEVNTNDTIPTAQVTGLENGLREDETLREVQNEDLLKSSPHPIVRNHISVPSVF